METKAGTLLVTRLGILLGAMLIMLLTCGVLQGFVNAAGSLSPRDAILLNSALQAILVFMVPAWVCARYTTQYPLHWLKVRGHLSWCSFAWAVLLLCVALPMVNGLVEWNKSWKFPSSWAAIEHQLKEWEEGAATVTEILLGDKSVTGLVSGIIVVGIITGLGEEAFFRGGIQRVLTVSGLNRHIAVWTAAALFSAIHFQFYGFVPRMVLGALCGYLYLCSGSLWVAAFAHALNNSAVVWAAWLGARGDAPNWLERIGTGPGGEWIATASAVMTAGIILILLKRHGKETYSPGGNRTQGDHIGDTQG